MKASRSIYHITSADAWQAAQLAGQYAAPSLGVEGFIHASTAEQVLATAERFYAGHSGLLLLKIDAGKLTSPLRYELAPAVGENFPHIYGPIDLPAVIWALPFAPDPQTGKFIWPEKG